MSKMISCSLKHSTLQPLLYGKYLFSSPIRGYNSINGVPRNYTVHVWTMRSSPSRHCSSLWCLFPVEMNSFYDNINKIIYSTILTGGLDNNNIQQFQKRCRSKKPQKRTEYDSGSDEEDDDDEDGLSKATKPVILRVQSLRLDGLLKKALGVARNKVETAFYEGSIRVNGTRPNKKSYQVKIGDEVDLIKGISPLNPDFVTVSRVEVLSVKEDSQDEEKELMVKVRRTKNMYIENYENDPWKRSPTT